VTKYISFGGLVLLVVGNLLAQSATTVPATLAKPLDTRSSKVGEQAVFKISEPIKMNGEVVLPVGSKLFAHVTEVKSHKGASNPEMALAFDKAEDPHGKSVPVAVSIASISRPQASSPPSDATQGGVGVPNIATGSPTAAARGGRSGGAMTDSPTQDKEKSSQTAVAGSFSLTQKDGASVISTKAQNIHLGTTTQFLIEVQPPKQ
jgi:hypothetical protein